MAAMISKLEDTTNVLLEEPPLGEGRDVCTSLLVGDVAEPTALFVSFTRSASDCVAQLDDEAVENIGVITVGDSSSSVDDDRVVTDTVSTPSDLTGLGISIGKMLSRWDAPVFVCFESLTSMLQYVEIQTAYEFLHAITGQIHAAGARAHFHIDPSAHDSKDVAGIASLFDGKVTLDGDDREIKTRSLLESGGPAD
ncbi:MAG: hypothetical protein V5A52_06480 [Halovenus sp.]|uniref:DUF7504 family protein n=1 Tax=Halovenus amylolytica TaxID=2500550 RepID=UPI000FE358E1